MLDLGRIGACSAHVLEGSPKVVHRAGMILPQRRSAARCRPKPYSWPGGLASLTFTLREGQAGRLVGVHREASCKPFDTPLLT